MIWPGPNISASSQATIRIRTHRLASTFSRVLQLHSRIQGADCFWPSYSCDGVVGGHSRILSDTWPVPSRGSQNRALLNRATIQVAHTTDVSGRGTAESIKRGVYAKNQSILCRLCSLTIFASVSLGVLAASAPIPALGDEIAVLKAQVATLQLQVQALQNQLAKVEHNNALLLDPFVTVDPNPEKGVIGPNIKFTGANIHILSGSNVTDDNGNTIGRGNLIIGYDEAPGPLNPGDRGGSHNLVVGRFNRFSGDAFGGLVAGEGNTIGNAAATVAGGNLNAATGLYASVTGGQSNTASGAFAAVSGGHANVASGQSASVSGGKSNLASGGNSAVIGGDTSPASETFSIRPHPPFNP